MHSTLGVSGTGTRLDLIEWLLLEHWNVSSSWALHGDGHRHNRTAWEVESILGVFWSSPFIFSFLTCLLDIREALCTSAYRFFFFFSTFFCCLHWTDSRLYVGRQKMPLFIIVIIVALFLLLASCAWHTQERACLRSSIFPLLSSYPFFIEPAWLVALWFRP